MAQQEIKNLLKLSLDPAYQTKESALEYLNNTGIDGFKLIADLKTLLDKKQAELDIENGRKFKENYLSMIKDPGMTGVSDGELSFAFRKKDGEDIPDDDNMDRKKMEILKKLKREEED